MPVLDNPLRSDYQQWPIKNKLKAGMSVVAMEEVVETGSLPADDRKWSLPRCQQARHCVGNPFDDSIG